MDLIILIPAVACWVALASGSVRKTLINVYLPVVLLLPLYYTLRFPHLPPLTFADTAILPLGVALWVREMRRWRLAWMDLWVVLFALSAALSEGLSAALANGQWTRLFSASGEPVPGNLANGGLLLFAEISSMVMPYMIGKLLIEREGAVDQPTRMKVVRRMVVLLAIVAGISVFDFATGRSSWQMVWSRVFAGQASPWPEQMRWGFGRIAGPYGHAILAGMVFLMGLVYCLWLRMYVPEWGTRKVIAGLPLTIRGLVLWAIVGGLLMTQSRGPWVGVGLSLVLAALARKLPIPKAVAVFLVVVAIFAGFAYYYGKQYTETQRNQATSEEQRNAIYRRELLKSYAPIILERKAFGWGITAYPAANGQQSIDNEFLLLAVTQGFFGLGLFLAILLGSLARLFRLAARPMHKQDRALVLAHLTVLIGLTTTLTTVFLGEQAFLLFFLIVGWVQGMNPAPLSAPAGGAFVPRFQFQRVLS